MIQAGTIRIGSRRTSLVAGRVLDEFDEPVAVDNLARCDCNVPADDEPFRTDWLLAADGNFPILNEMVKTSDEIESSRSDRAFKEFGIHQRDIRRRDHVEKLARSKPDHLLVFC
jgi:hypothetical protein